MGQVKLVQNMTPWWCENWVHADISLGTMRNGVGSMSTQDMWMWVPDAAQAAILKRSSEDGTIVKITYDVARSRGWFSCEELEEITNVEVLR